MNQDALPADTDESAKTKPTYTGRLASPDMNGEVMLTINKDGLLADSLFDQAALPYADVNKIVLQDNTVLIGSSAGNLMLSHMGSACEWFHRELLEAYNTKVLQALLVEGASEFETKGAYLYDGKQGHAIFQVFKDCLCILPPNTDARRIPFLFVNGLSKEGYTLILTLSTGERYTLSQIGYDLEPLEKQISDHIRSLQDNNAVFIKSIDDSLGFAQTVQAARLMPEGGVVSLQKLTSSIPPLSITVSKKVMNSKMVETYELLQNICDGERLCIGIKAVPPEEVEAMKESLLIKLNEGAENPIELTLEQEDSLRWIVWAAVPSKDGRTAVVEYAFPNEPAATYLFRIENEWDSFLPILNRAMEAVQLKREVISLPDEKMKNEQYANYRMAVIRTPALQELRRLFAGRVIHRSLESWKESVLNIIGKPSVARPTDATLMQRFCTDCGTKLTGSMSFCGECGKKI